MLFQNVMDQNENMYIITLTFLIKGETLINGKGSKILSKGRVENFFITKKFMSRVEIFIKSNKLEVEGCKCFPKWIPYPRYLNPGVLFFQMLFWMGFNSNLAVICPSFANFWPKIGFLTGVVLEYSMGGVLFKSGAQITWIR